MPQKITTGFRALVDAAEREIETLSVEEAIALHGRDDVAFIDVRDIRELDREGRMPGAFHSPRGMLEFWIDPESPYHKAIFGEEKRFVFFCAGGWRSALAAQTAHRMGLRPVPISRADLVHGAKLTAHSNRPRPSPNLSRRPAPFRGMLISQAWPKIFCCLGLGRYSVWEWR